MHRLCALAIMFACPTAAAEEARTGIASFYSAVPDRSEKFTAAHRHLPFGTMVMVTRLDTGSHVVVRINDRGPFIKGRIIDVSAPAAEQLGLVAVGLARVRIQVVPAPRPATRAALGVKTDFGCPSCRLPSSLD